MPEPGVQPYFAFQWGFGGTLNPISQVLVPYAIAFFLGGTCPLKEPQTPDPKPYLQSPS